MSYWAGFGFGPRSSRMLASEADREATEAVLKQAFEDQRLRLDEFEYRIGRALAARTQGELARLTRDLPTAPVPPVPPVLPVPPVTGGQLPARPRLNPRRQGGPRQEAWSRQFRLVPPEVCPACGSVLESYHDGRCFKCNIHSLSRIAGVPDLIKKILVNLPVLELESAIEQFLARAPQLHSTILALTTAVAGIGVRIRDAHSNEDVRQSGLRHLSADDIWLLNLTLDVMYMLAGQLPGKNAPWDDDHDLIPGRLRSLNAATRNRRWKLALRQAGAGPAQFQRLRAQVAPRTPSRR